MSSKHTKAGRRASMRWANSRALPTRPLFLIEGNAAGFTRAMTEMLARLDDLASRVCCVVLPPDASEVRMLSAEARR